MCNVTRQTQTSQILHFRYSLRGYVLSIATVNILSAPGDAASFVRARYAPTAGVLNIYFEKVEIFAVVLVEKFEDLHKFTRVEFVLGPE